MNETWLAERFPNVEFDWEALGVAELLATSAVELVAVVNPDVVTTVVELDAELVGSPDTLVLAFCKSATAVRLRGTQRNTFGLCKTDHSFLKVGFNGEVRFLKIILDIKRRTFVTILTCERISGPSP